MNALESLASYLLPKRQRVRGHSSVERALDATDDLIAKLRDSFHIERDRQKAAIEARHRL